VTPPFTRALPAVALALLSIASSCAAAPYELTVYADDLPEPGEGEVETIFSFAKPRPDDDLHATRVTQAQGEIGYGLRKGWALGLQIPAVDAGQTRKIEGAAVELQYVAPHDDTVGGYWGLRGEIGRQASVYENRADTGIELNPVIGYRSGHLHIVINPSLELPLHAESSRVTFQPSAKAVWLLPERNSVGVEYYGNWGPVSSWLPVGRRDETLFAVWNRQLAFAQLNLGWGKGLHPVLGSADRWVTKIALQFELD
jgi:hypothetical protein